MKRHHVIKAVVAVCLLALAGANLPVVAQDSGSGDLMTVLAEARTVLAQAFTLAVESARRIAEKAAAGDLDGLGEEQARSSAVVGALADALAAVDDAMKAVQGNDAAAADTAMNGVKSALQQVINALTGVAPSSDGSAETGGGEELDDKMTGGDAPINPYEYLGDPEFLKEVGRAIHIIEREATLGGAEKMVTPE
ncbi:MAG: hypothetical protein K9M45_08350 [Kiritimatiellales bacterium]|nr:hypothetical protein [Kiritimatiellales bacterium]